MSAVKFAKIHKLVFEIFCLQKLIYTVTHRHIRVHSQSLLVADIWNIDAMIMCVCRFSCLQDMDAIRMLKIMPTTLVIYLTLLESHYSTSNPYHNNVHAADVVQSANVLLRRPALQVSLMISYLALENYRVKRFSLTLVVCLWSRLLPPPRCLLNV